MNADGFRMSHVALTSKDVAQTALVFETLGHSRKDRKVAGALHPRVTFEMGRAELVILPLRDSGADAGDKAGVRHVALSVANFSGERERADQAGLTEVGLPRAGVDGSSELAFDPSTTGNIRVVLTDRFVNPDTEGSAIDHIGVASTDNDAIANVFVGYFGLALHSVEMTVETVTHTRILTSSRYGTTTHAYTPSVLASGSTMFVDLGAGELECTCDTTPIITESSGAARRADVGEFARFIRTRGPGLHHLAIRTRSIARDMENLARAGIPLIDSEPRIGARSSKICFIHPRGAGGVLMHLVERPD